MESARYGRMRFGRCMRENHGSEGCAADVLPHVDRICSGRHQCQMQMPDATLHNIHPCPKELVPYLEAKYTCVKVKSGNQHSCTVFGGQRLTGESGYLASITPAEHPSGSRDCPWIIHVGAGQNVNLSLIHFGSPDKETTDQVLDNLCASFVVIREGNKTTEIPVCKERERERVVYLSKTNQIQVYLHKSRQELTGRFLLKYQAIGCPDITSVQNAVVTRNGGTTRVKCNYTGETYFLSCTNSRWKGELNNCTRAVPWGASMKIEKVTRFPYGLLIVIGIGVALGVALGIILLFGILFCLRKRKEERLRSHTTDPLLSQSDTQIEAEENHVNNYQSSKECGSAGSTLARSHQLRKAPSYIVDPAQLCQQLSNAQYQQRQQQQVLYPHGHAEMQNGGELAHPGPISAAEGQALIPCGHVEYCSCDRSVAVRRISFPNELERSDGDETQQTSFITFKPDSQQGVYGRLNRTLQRGASLDLIKDSEPSTYRQLQPDTLVVECSCTLRQGGHQYPECARSLPRSSANTGV